MRSLTRRAGEDDEQDSSFVSMTDLTVSFLFIVMLLMAFFATRYADETPDPLEEYLQRAAEARLRVLEALRQGIKAQFPNLVVQISSQGDALQLQGEGLFETNKSSLKERPRRIVRTIAATLHDVLRCYTTGPLSAWRESCNEHQRGNRRRADRRPHGHPRPGDGKPDAVDGPSECNVRRDGRARAWSDRTPERSRVPRTLGFRLRVDEAGGEQRDGRRSQQKPAHRPTGNHVHPGWTGRR